MTTHGHPKNTGENKEREPRFVRKRELVQCKSQNSLAIADSPFRIGEQDFVRLKFLSGLF
jgi:hypothetical protein